MKQSHRHCSLLCAEKRHKLHKINQQIVGDCAENSPKLRKVTPETKVCAEITLKLHKLALTTILCAEKRHILRKLNHSTNICAEITLKLHKLALTTILCAIPGHFLHKVSHYGRLCAEITLKLRKVNHSTILCAIPVDSIARYEELIDVTPDEAAAIGIYNSAGERKGQL